MDTHKEFSVKIKKPSKITHTPKIQPNTASQPLVTSGRLVMHSPKAGINPLVDAASYLFSLLGRIKRLRQYRYFNHLQKELTESIQAFQENAKTLGYSTDFVLASRYALCATFDDVIANTPWGLEGQWEPHCLQLIFNPQEAPNPDRFFLILERIVRDPAFYIDLMELMYICLTFGFKGKYRHHETLHAQLDQITDSLYKRIRAFQGNTHQELSPFPIRTSSTLMPPPQKNISFLWLTTLGATLCIILSIFIGLSYLLDSISNNAYEALLHIGKSILL